MHQAENRAGRDPAPAVSRSVGILGLLAQSSRPLRLTDLASALGLAKSSTANLCQALEEAHMIQRVETGYRLGRRTAEFGAAFVAQSPQIRDFHLVCSRSPVLRREFVQVAILDGASCVCLARHETPESYRLGAALGSRFAAVSSAAGQALLMRLDDDDIRARLRSQPPSSEPAAESAMDDDSLFECLARARHRGWVLATDKSSGGVADIAVSVDPRSAGGPPLALEVTMVRAELDDARTGAVVEALREAAEVLAKR